MMRMLMPRFDFPLRPWMRRFGDWMEPYPVEYQEWVPAADISETENAYLVTMELPGIDIKKTDISYSDGMLTVKGEKHKETMEGEYCDCAERYSGSFRRSLRIPGKVASDRIDATYNDGILKLTLPKAEETIPRKITVH